MSIYKAFRDRVRVNGSTYQEGVQGSSKQLQYTHIMTSPTRSSVDEMKLVKQKDGTFELELKESRYSIVSDIDSFYKRVILFLPDTVIKLGTYIQHKDDFYLVTKTKGNEIHPETEIQFCNFDFPIEVEKEKIMVGRDPFGNPIWDEIGKDYTIPSVATSKIYSALDNSQMPLPVGALYVYVPYHEDIHIPINYEFTMYGDTYQVTSAPKTHLLKNKDGTLYGYLELRGQRKDDDK